MKATGPGLEPGCKAGRRLPITVDSRKAGKAPLKVAVTDEVGNPVDVEMDEIEPGLDEVAYTPKTPGIVVFVCLYLSTTIETFRKQKLSSHSFLEAVLLLSLR